MDRERLRQLLRAVASASRRGILTRDGIEGIAKVITIATTITTRDGGPESGNWGHAGRPGQVGGSSAGGGRTSEAARQEKIDSVHIDFSRDNILPELNREDLRALGKTSKPVLLKKEVIDRNLARHPEVAPEDYDKIIGQALYNSDLRFRNTSGRYDPNYVNFVKQIAHNNMLVTIQLANYKDNYEIIHLFTVGDRNLSRIKKK
ncbi:MAG: hypothetical protein LBD85_01495 [Oscillospiraceae bacterium]|jgi:hypothetical protein|nr:hypothetical protein [Oscillospiraceae bacterium]